MPTLISIVCLFPNGIRILSHSSASSLATCGAVGGEVMGWHWLVQAHHVVPSLPTSSSTSPYPTPHLFTAIPPSPTPAPHLFTPPQLSILTSSSHLPPLLTITTPPHPPPLHATPAPQPYLFIPSPTLSDHHPPTLSPSPPLTITPPPTPTDHHPPTSHPPTHSLPPGP